MDERTWEERMRNIINFSESHDILDSHVLWQISMAMDVQTSMCSTSSSNTLKSLTNPHTIRGIATLKDVERFRKGHLTRYRESIVKLIVKLIVNYLSKLPILSKANYILTTYTGSDTKKNSNNEYQQSTIDEKAEITSTQSEDYKGLPTSVYSKPCDSQSGRDFPKLVTSFSKILMLSMLLFLLFFIQGNISRFIVLIVAILTVLAYKTFKFFDYYTQTVVTSSFSDYDILDKTNCLTVHVAAEVTIGPIKITRNTRSRFIYKTKPKFTEIDTPLVSKYYAMFAT